MKILIACEFSGTVRDAFIARDHNAWSCDLLPTEKKGPHIQDDVLKHLNEGWDLMIAFPPCTHLSVSGARWFKIKTEEQKKAIDFFIKLVVAHIPRIMIENPIGIMSTLYRKPDQIIQPWMFGHAETKATCLWLENLPILKPTNIVGEKLPLFGKDGHREQRIWKEPPSSDRWKNRSRTYQGIANAMAEQWG